MVARESAKHLVKGALGQRNWMRLKRAKDAITGTKYGVLIDTTNGCNYRCAFCTRDSGKTTMMTVDQFDVIMSRVRQHIGSLQLSCAWEYSIAKNAAEIVRVLGEYHIPMTTIYTNGSILPDELAHAVVDAKIGDFVVSIGEAKKETYEKIRMGGSFERVSSNIRRLNELKKERNGKYPRLCANLTLINSNIDELIEFVDLAHSLGIENIRGRHLILNQGLDMDDEIIHDRVRANNVIDSACTRARECGISFTIPFYSDSDQVPPKNCRAPWCQIYISSNGDVSVCPRIHVYERIGNLIDADWQTVVGSSAMKDLKRQFIAGDFNNPVCGICMANKESEIAIDQGF